MIPQLSIPLNNKLKSVLREEYKRLDEDHLSWVRTSRGGHRWVADEAVLIEMCQIKTMYKTLFGEDINENTVQRVPEN